MTQAFLRMSPGAADFTAPQIEILRPKVLMMTPSRGVDAVTCDRLEMSFRKSPLNRPHTDDLFPCYQKQANVHCKKGVERPPSEKLNSRRHCSIQGYIMNKFLLSAVLLLSTLATAPVQAQSAQDFILVNKTGYALSEIYISPAKADHWGDDLLENEDDAMEDGASQKITFSNAGRVCHWDLKVVYEEDDSEAVWQDINLCDIRKITIRWNKKTEVTSATFD